MSIARHHNEWLSLLEVSGPFLSCESSCGCFRRVEEHERESAKRLRSRARWVEDRHVRHPYGMDSTPLREAEYPDDHLVSGQSLPAGLDVAFPSMTSCACTAEAPADERPRLLVTASAAAGSRSAGGRRAWKATPGTRMMTLLHGRRALGLVTNGGGGRWWRRRADDQLRFGTRRRERGR
jgi:hypothetical protein